ELGNRHKDANGNLMGDYEQGWERKIPDSRTAVGNNDWECVMTIPENGWGYAKKWMGHWKTPVELLEMTAKCVSLGGNFVINFGPMANGAFRPEEEETAATIGRWMKQNHQAIYNSSWASGWAKQDWGYITQPRQPNKINLIVFNVPVAKTLLVKPPKGTTIVKATLMVANKTALTIKPVDYGEVQIILPAKWNAAEPFVIELQTEFNQKQNNAEGPKANT
ncbi:MAG TPA: alpha-L-fucosidase, partial [Phnomibacter sp.]|nr:alpha-L-fucosidase [Phnomibacter sp.]